MSVHQVFGWTTFVVPHNSSGGDDMPTLTAAFVSSNGTTRNLAVNSTIIFKKGITYNFFSAIRLPVLQNLGIRIEGNMSYLEDIPALQAVAAAKGYPGAMMTFAGGTNVTLRGTTDCEWGWINGHGQAVHCLFLAFCTIQSSIPHQVVGCNGINPSPSRDMVSQYFHNITGGTIRDMKIYKPIGWNYETTGSSNVHVFGNTILAKSDTDSFPFNTQVIFLLIPLAITHFGAQGTNQLFENNYVVNRDNCITITNGAVNITFRDAYCKGSHGLSTTIAGNKTFAMGENFLFENKSGLYGTRFKSFTGGPGLTRNVTYRNIQFVDTIFPIYVTQNHFLFKNFSGTIRDIGPNEGSCISDPCWFFVANVTGREVVILDLYPGTATNVRMKNIVDVMCSTVDVTNDIGFICQDGAFICTKAGI
ncbi:pectin lyase-like protein [Mycena albidolilacea]|uniref:galacturonan 1,4-alpha-galacturonidase n=1 Tax=Mycena albidolilacea TaxID=1033008 RepID=A0AAD7EKR3_9AGAR|nr:pectin lyase-like protein [Mycena albidolilacea]